MDEYIEVTIGHGYCSAAYVFDGKKHDLKPIMELDFQEWLIECVIEVGARHTMSHEVPIRFMTHPRS